MNITSRQIKGKGRGKLLGYPTINLEIPARLDLAEGIWAAWVTIAGKRYAAALHFGPIPTFGEQEKSLEVFLLDTTDDDLAGTENASIEVDPVARLRDILSFDSPESLARQIKNDVAEVCDILKL